jgi:hypothetical protein
MAARSTVELNAGFGWVREQNLKIQQEKRQKFTGGPLTPVRQGKSTHEVAKPPRAFPNGYLLSLSSHRAMTECVSSHHAACVLQIACDHEWRNWRCDDQPARRGGFSAARAASYGYR